MSTVELLYLKAREYRTVSDLYNSLSDEMVRLAQEIEQGAQNNE